MPSPPYIFGLLLALALSFGSATQARVRTWSQQRHDDPGLLTVALGDARRIFANHFATKADVYFHSGYYPSIFSSRKLHEKPHVAEQDDEDDHAGETPEEHAKHSAHGDTSDVLGTPHDVLESFGRHFFVTRHTHLGNGNEREILPWLELAAEMDPNRVESYTVASYWLRSRLRRVDEAERFLRTGWRLNPQSPEILFELGQLFFYDRNDIPRARNIWEYALVCWHKQEAGKEDPDVFLLEEILGNLASLEREHGTPARAIRYLEAIKPLSPVPAAIQRQIDELKQKTAP